MGNINTILKKKGPRIMIVDDVYFNIEIMKDVLQQVLQIDVDNDVVEAYNGKEAVIKYLQLQNQFKICPIEIILMDCDMPVMNGFVASEHILKISNFFLKKLDQNQLSSFKKPTIVAITGDSGRKQQELAKKSGMKMMLSKPINSKNIFKLLQNHGILK